MQLKTIFLSLVLGLFCQMAMAQFVQIDSIPGAKGLFGTNGFFGSKDSTLYYIVKNPNGTLAIKTVINGKNPQIIVDNIPETNFIQNFTVVDNNVFFVITENSLDETSNLYKSNGTKNTTTVVLESERIENLRVFKNNLIFSEVYNSSVYMSMYNISKNQRDLLNKFDFWGALDMVVKDSTIYLIGDKQANQIALLSSKGKKNDLVSIKTLKNDNNSHIATNMTISGNNIYFFCESKTLNNVRCLWASDGTANGTKEIIKNNQFYIYGDHITYNGKFYVRVTNMSGDNVLYVSDGTLNGTKEVSFKPILSGSDSKYLYPTNLTIYKNKLYFTASDNFFNKKLWVVDGNNPAEEAVMKDSRDIYPTKIEIFKDSILVIGFKQGVGTEFLLFGGSGNYSDLTNENAITPSIFMLGNFKKVGSKLYVIANFANTGQELWEFKSNYVEPLSLSITQIAAVKCNGDKNATIKAVAINGTSPFTYLWNTGATTAEITGLGAGDYSVTVTEADNKTSISTITVTEPSPIILTTTSKAGNPQYKNGNAVVTASGGTAPYSYLWNTVPIQTTATAKNLVPGNYSATVTDANSCKAITNVTVTLSTSSNELWEKYHFEVFPNPASDVLNIKYDFNDNNNVEVLLYDQTGRLLLTQTINSTQTSLNISDLPKGIYTLKCHMANEDATTTVVKD